MGSIQLSKDLLDHFKISDFKQMTTPSGQKTVFMVEIEGVKHALKIIHVADERFEREVKICQEFTDTVGIPCITRIEKFQDDTIILEEYIDGKDLSEVITDYKGDEIKVRHLIHSISTILSPVWKARYVHRDLKPQNIRISKEGTTFVLDFGIARALSDESITAAGNQPMSWLYASPEQYAGKKELISYRTDFFCLGIIAYFLYTGEYPFGRKKAEIELVFSKPQIQVASGNDNIDKFCNAVFQFDPSQRPGRIEAFLDLIKL